MNQRTKLLPLSYLGPIQLFAHLKDGDEIVIEQHCNYQRKTYRSRCNILDANGPLSLSIPVVNKKNQKILTKDTLIAYDTNWQKQHWRSIVSAYNSSPYFEYYADDFELFYQKRFESLVDFNHELFKVIIELLELDVTYKLSSEFTDFENQFEDLRTIIHPRNDLSKDPNYKNISYRQVFAEKHAFEPNLSIIDLLFNKGPESGIVLAESIVD
ncbi:WbqC family protein [Carboxylicivirga sp. N1Y90]|uniref:WbqC family protein n=1 Tax=Carboxylicivirga fragile TaxID=3417571 RepID=UPI003D338967|nr:WbqC family protein [Marinilabiliaceae bacterium N1Y90]